MATQGKTLKGEIIETLPSVRFLVECEDGEVRRCYLSGKMNRNFIRTMVGDKVLVLVPDHGDISRIIKRI